MTLFKILRTPHKRQLLIGSIVWAYQCYRKGWISKPQAIEHVKTTYNIVNPISVRNIINQQATY